MNKVYTFEPGNATRYVVAIAQIETPNSKTCYLVSYINAKHGPSMLFFENSPNSLTYIAGNMGIDISDAAAVMTFVSKKIPIEITDLYQWNSILGMDNVTAGSA